MVKKKIIVPLLLLCSMLFAVPVMASEPKAAFVYDDAELFDQSEADSISEKISDFSSETRSTGTGVTVGSGVGVSGVGVSGTGVTVGSGSGVSGTGVGSAGSGVGSSDGTSGSDETSPVVSSPEELKSSELDPNSSDVYTVSSAANTGMDPDKIIPDASVRHINLVRYLFFIYLNCSLLSAAYSRPLFPEICISSIA